MFQKKILSIIAIAIYTVFACASDEGTPYVIVAFVVVLGIMIAIICFLNQKNEKEEKKAKEEKRKQEEEYQLKLAEQREVEREEKYKKLISIMSSPNKIIEYDYDHYIMVDETTSQIMMNEHIYNFKDIINYTLSDNATVIQKHSGGNITSTSSTDTGSMLGRAVVGGVLAGGVGAAIGGSTAKRETTSIVAPTKTTSSTIHDYLIAVTVNSLSNPIERLKLGEDENNTNEICALLSVIISRNNNP